MKDAVIKKEILNFITKVNTNKDGVKYNAVPINQRVMMKDVLTRYYKALRTLFADKEQADKIFVSKLKLLDAIRHDAKDEKLYPLAFMYQDMRGTNEGKQKPLDGGLFMPKHGDIVGILNADFKKSKEEMVHTDIHELTHLMTVKLLEDNTEEKHYQTGLQQGRNAISRMLNEGLTEYIAQIMWVKMYPKIKCPGVGRYGVEVNVVQAILSVLDSKDAFLEDYLTDSRLVVAHLKRQLNNNNQNMYDYLQSLNKDKNLKPTPDVVEKVVKEIKTFTYVDKAYTV